MTAIRGTIKPTRRPGELGVHSLDRFHFSAPDLDVAKSVLRRIRPRRRRGGQSS